MDFIIIVGFIAIVAFVIKKRKPELYESLLTKLKLKR
jgi:Na+-translocating ferredoxin:NAD+ oxidoreductase RnfA subunit